MNKNKRYVRRWVCSICGSRVIAEYSYERKTWALKCSCGTDYSYTKLNSSIWSKL